MTSGSPPIDSELKRRDEASIYLDASLESLSGMVRGEMDRAEIYCHVVATIANQDGFLIQTGCGPNFDGGCITLCTCMHQMRAFKSPEEWRNGAYWVAGFSSGTKSFRGSNWLVYLMKVGDAYASQYDLISALRSQGRCEAVKAKLADSSPRGDIYQPLTSSPMSARDRYSPRHYRPPIPGHVHEDTYQHDINFVWRGLRRPALLVGDLAQSFLWTRPTIRRARHRPLPRGSPRTSLSVFLDDLVDETKSNSAAKN